MPRTVASDTAIDETHRPGSRVLYAFGGLPGTGKSTLARLLAEVVRATYVRADTIEDTMRVAGITLEGPEGYLVAYSVARDNLRLGQSVVADCVNPIAVTRDAWRDVAAHCDARLIEIEVVCSDRDEHRQRVEARTPDITGSKALTWEEVVEREYEPWSGSPVIIDTAGSDVAQSLALLRNKLRV